MQEAVFQSPGRVARLLSTTDVCFATHLFSEVPVILATLEASLDPLPFSKATARSRELPPLPRRLESTSQSPRLRGS